MEKFKVTKSVYYSVTGANSLYASGEYQYLYARNNGYNLCSGHYAVSMSSIADNASFKGSKLSVTMDSPSGEKKHVDLFVRNFAVSDYDVKKIFRLVSKQSDFYMLREADYTTKDIKANLCVRYNLYDFNTQRLVLLDIPRYLFVLCHFDNSEDDPDGMTLGIYGSSSLELPFIEDIESMIDHAPYWGHIRVARDKGVHTLIGVHGLYDAMSKDKNGNIIIDKDYLKLPYRIKYLFDTYKNVLKEGLQGEGGNELCYIPYESHFPDSKMMLDIIEKYVDTYIKEQGWGEYLEL